MSFDKQLFASLLAKAKGINRSINKYSIDSGVDPGYISRLLRCLIDTPPSANIISKLADKAYDNVSAKKLLIAAGYIKQETLQVSEESFEYLDYGQVGPTPPDVYSPSKEEKEFFDKIQKTLSVLSPEERKTRIEKMLIAIKVAEEMDKNT